MSKAKLYGIFLSTYGDAIVNKWCDANPAGRPKSPFKDYSAAAFTCKLYQDRNPKGNYSVREVP